MNTRLFIRIVERYKSFIINLSNFSNLNYYLICLTIHYELIYRVNLFITSVNCWEKEGGKRLMKIFKHICFLYMKIKCLHAFICNIVQKGYIDYLYRYSHHDGPITFYWEMAMNMYIPMITINKRSS